MGASKADPPLGKRQRQEGGTDSELESDDSEEEGELSHKQPECAAEEGVVLLADQPSTCVGEGSTPRKRKKKKLSREKKELLRRQEVMLLYLKHSVKMSGLSCRSMHFVIHTVSM